MSSEAGLRERTAVLYAEHHSWLARWLRYRTANSDCAADLAHDTFMRVLTAKEIPPLSEPRAFLATIARRLLSNHYRREMIERAYLEALANLPEAVEPSSESRHIVIETLLAIDRALDSLPGKVREAFLLAQLEGLRHEDIAARLGVTTRTVSNYMVRAVQACFFAQDGFA
ncbi:sigma-70 family RNA polymerase sigma factor [Achromobacter insuavis]|uniref:sigma-70 family RNA polymerase sigma factor n=1 Tax=Achromobacter insuavis TaxID=1287735 RepID=UPI001F1430C1|nr:sigma-70 family RNA polymerase sigma factor [Achromobacter insuavis]